MQAGIVFIPVAREVFSLVSLNGIQWLYVTLISIAPIAIMELQKKLNEVIFGKTVYKYKEIKSILGTRP